VTTKGLACEDEPLARETLRDIIAARPGLLLVGEAADGAQALNLLRPLAPVLVFMDIQMPEMTCLEVLRRLGPMSPAPAAMFATAHDQHAVTAVRIPLSELDPRLSPDRFLPVHRNAVVNLDFVQSMKPDEQSQLEILMRDGSKLLANREASKRQRDESV
jgi:two-component system LytT family response regulator